MKFFLPTVRIYLFFSVLLGLVYPFGMTFLSETLFPDQAKGSLIKNKDGQWIGSKLIAQKFTNPKYFWPRPSAVDYNPLPSGGSNLGPISQDLAVKIKERQAQGLSSDLLYASGSGLDPHISPEAALSQVSRVAQARGMIEEELRATVQKYIENRALGFLGEKHVNVLLLNLALDQR